MAWIRTDGRPIAPDPVLAQQFQLDKSICLGPIVAEISADVTDAIVRSCMAEKGYALVPEEQAEAQREQFVYVAALKQSQQVVQAQPLLRH